MYRVFGCGGTTPEDIIMAAIMKAADDGADVISMSLGGRAGWEFFDNYGTIVSNLESRNIGLIASAGNSGEEGPYYASTPSLSPGIISVGSVSNTKFPTMYNAKDSLGRTIEYASNFPWDVPNGMDIWMMGNATDDPTYDFFQSGCWESGWWVAAENIPEENRPNTLVVIPAMPAVCAIADLTENMLHFNFTKLFLYVWDQDGHDMSVWPPGSYGAVEMIKTTQHHAEKIVSGASKSNAYTISFTDKTVHSIKQVTAGTVSYFSSYGPTVEMSLKPQLSAPGGNILSSWPLEGNGYVTISGTSMAAPFVAGCYALIKSQFQTLSPSEIRILMQTTSTPLKEYNGDILTSTAQQGSGLINPYKAITYESRVLTGELNWRDSEAPAPQEITIENKSSRSKTYIIGHQGAAYMDVFPWYDNDDSDWLSWSLVNEAKYSTVTFSANSITIPAGKAANIVVTLSPPKTTQVNRLPFYSGYVTIQNNNDHFNVPYIGVPYTRSEQSHLDNTDFAGFVLPRVRSVYPATSVEDLRVFTFRAAVPVEDEDQDDDDPAVLSFWVKQISPYFRWDLVPADTTFVPTYYGFNQSNKFPVIEPPIDIGELDTFHNVSSYGTLFGVSNVDSPTNSRFYGLVGTTILSSLVWTAPVTFLANETWIILPDGDYRPLLRVMRWGGNWENPDDFESWLGPVLRVAYNPLALPPVLED
jgi:hypothetical protein